MAVTLSKNDEVFVQLITKYALTPSRAYEKAYGQAASSSRLFMNKLRDKLRASHIKDALQDQGYVVEGDGVSAVNLVDGKVNTGYELEDISRDSLTETIKKILNESIRNKDVEEIRKNILVAAKLNDNFKDTPQEIPREMPSVMVGSETLEFDVGLRHAKHDKHDEYDKPDE